MIRDKIIEKIQCLGMKLAGLNSRIGSCEAFGCPVGCREQLEVAVRATEVAIEQYRALLRDEPI